MKVLLALVALVAVASACTVTQITGGLAVSDCGTGSVSLTHVNNTDQTQVLDGAGGALLFPPTNLGTGAVNLLPTRVYVGSSLAIPQEGKYYVRRTLDSVATWVGPFATKCADFTTRATASDPLTPPLFVPSGSGLQNIGGVPKLTLKFTADGYHNAVGFEFLYQNNRSDSRCGADFNGDSSKNVRGTTFANGQTANGESGNGLWSFVNSTTGTLCGSGSHFQYVVNDFNNALTHCGWAVDESASGVTTMKTTVLMTTLEQGVVIRNVLYKKTLESAVQLGIEFQTNVTATTGNLTIFGPQILYSTIIKQTFEPQNSCANWLLLTSVQGPYQLYPSGSGNYFNPGLTISADATAWTSKEFHALGNLPTARTGAQEVALLAMPTTPSYAAAYGADATSNTGATLANLAKCVNNGLATANYAANDSATTPYVPCNQYWFIRGCKGCAAGFESTQTLNYGWTAQFDVVCHNTFSGACSTPQNSTVTVSWSTSSDNYCPRIIDTESSTADLRVYQNSDGTATGNVKALADSSDGATFSVEQSQFVFGTYSFFEATTTSTIKINDLEIERIVLTAGGSTNLAEDGTGGPRIVFKRESFNGEPWFKTRSGYNTAVTSYVGGTSPTLSGNAPNNGANFAINKNVTVNVNSAANPLQRKCQFQWIWGSPISAASGDFPVSTTVQVDLRVRYTDQNAKYMVLSTKFIPDLQADTGATATRTVGVQGSTGTTTPVGGGASAEGSAALSTGTIAIGAAAVGGVALIAAATVVAVRRRRKSAEVDTNIESIQLGGGSSQAQLNTV